MRLLEFIAELERHRASYQITVARTDALMVEVAVPGERWEIEFFDSEKVEIERFRSSGEILDQSALTDLWLLLQ